MPNLIELALVVSGSLLWSPQVSNTSSGLRGLCVVSPEVVWASGTNGTFVRTTDGGVHWRSAVVPGAEQLDFRDVEAFDANTAYLLASGEGELSRVYKTIDGGAHWQLLFTNPDSRGFFDSLAFWDARHGILLGDPVNGHFVIYTTSDGGAHWQRRRAPAATLNEGAFAASGTSVITTGSKRAWFATGGPSGGRVFRSNNRGRAWAVARTALGGTNTAGIFSIAFKDDEHGVAVGGDYQNPKGSEHTAALTADGGRTWHDLRGLEYRSGVASIGSGKWIAVGPSGCDISADNGETWRPFSDLAFNAVFGAGGAVWAVGPKGAIAKLAGEF